MSSSPASPAAGVVLHTRVKDARAIVQATCALPLAVLPPELVRAAEAGDDRPRLCHATVILQTQAATPGAPWTTLYTFLPHEAVATCGPPGVCDTALPTPTAAVHVTLLHTGLATLQRLLSLTTTPQSSHAPYGMPPHGYRLIAILQPAASNAHSSPGLVLTLPLHGVSPFRTSRVDMGLWYLLQQRAHAALRSTMAVLHRRGIGTPAPHEPQVMVEVEHATEDTCNISNASNACDACNNSIPCNPCNACAARDSQDPWTAAACPLAIGAMAARAWSPSGACSTTPFLMHLYPRLPLRTLHVNTVRDGRKTVLCLSFPTLPIPHTMAAVLAEAAHASAAACGEPLLPLALLAHCEKHANGSQRKKHAAPARRGAPHHSKNRWQSIHAALRWHGMPRAQLLLPVEELQCFHPSCRSRGQVLRLLLRPLDVPLTMVVHGIVVTEHRAAVTLHGQRVHPSCRRSGGKGDRASAPPSPLPLPQAATGPYQASHVLGRHSDGSSTVSCPMGSSLPRTLPLLPRPDRSQVASCQLHRPHALAQVIVRTCTPPRYRHVQPRHVVRQSRELTAPMTMSPQAVVHAAGPAAVPWVAAHGKLPFAFTHAVQRGWAWVSAATPAAPATMMVMAASAPRPSMEGPEDQERQEGPEGPVLQGAPGQVHVHGHGSRRMPMRKRQRVALLQGAPTQDQDAAAATAVPLVI